MRRADIFDYRLKLKNNSTFYDQQLKVDEIIIIFKNIKQSDCLLALHQFNQKKQQ